jgi:glycosyltransferase involved in cell wall biosynthesis
MEQSMVGLIIPAETYHMRDKAIPLCHSNRPFGLNAFFSICIPQHDRTDFLMKAIDSFRSQRFADFEVCISDDCSTDQKHSVLLDHLNNCGLMFVYARTKHRLKYDGNLRSAIALSMGRYILLMGNDDELSDPRCLAISPR